MPQFKYGPVEIAYLKDRDPGLGAVIDRLGRREPEVQPDLWTARVRRVVAQQISNAAATVWRRLEALRVDVMPKR